MADIEIGPDGSPIITPKIPSDSEFEQPKLPVKPNPVTPFSLSVTPTPTSGTHQQSESNTKVQGIVPPIKPVLPKPALNPTVGPKMAVVPEVLLKKTHHIIPINTLPDKLTQIKALLTNQGMDSQQAEKAYAEIKSILEL